jgi:hypothetical protein
MAKKSNQYNEHHRVPLSRGGSDNQSNLSVVRISHHRAYHQMFGCMTPEQIAKYLNLKWIDPKKMFIVVDRPIKAIMPELPFKY